MSANSISKATGVDWSDWNAWLTAQGARDADHPQIAKLALQRVHELGITHHAVSGKPFNDGWWAQSIAIEFERSHGLREVGQLASGDHAITASKKIVGTLDELLERWIAAVGNRTELDGVGIEGEPRTSATEKWRYWRANLSDGSKANVDISADRIAVQHAKLSSPAEGDRWRTYWKALLARV